MSHGFYDQVSRFYHLLDLDGDGRIDRDEARLGFTQCFSDVHRDPDALENREAVLAQQVSWLFSAAADSDVPTDHVNEEAFKACYQKLLAAAYEEEVLAIDLKRAIESLSNSPEWQASMQLFTSIRNVFTTLGTSELTPNTDPKHRATLDALFSPITGRSATLGPRSQTTGRKLIGAVVGAQKVSLDDIIRLMKGLIAVPIPVEVLKQGVDSALQAATGSAATPAGGSSASSAPASSASSTSAPMTD